MRHKIGVSSMGVRPALDARVKALLRRCAEAALDCGQAGLRFELQLHYATDERIRSINVAQRGIDAPTDVLSFPAVDFAGGEHPVPDPGTGRVYLGDIVLSPDRARAQAAEYGHGEDREMGFLVVHGALHLLGFDHENEDDRLRMRAAEKRVLDKLALWR